MTRKRDCAAARPTAESLLPRRPPTSMQQLKPSTPFNLPAGGLGQLGQETRPKRSGGQLWNERRPLMFLWLPNTNSGARKWLHGQLSHCVAGSSVGGLIWVTGDGGRNEDCTNCAPLRECAATL